MLGLLAGALALAGCTPQQLQDPPFLPGPAPVDAGRPDLGGFPDIGNLPLLVDRLVPSHGPFAGDTEVLVRGVGFAEGATVTIGGRLIPDNDTEYVDPNRVSTLTPAGEPGPADVTVTVGDATFTLPGGYTYDAIQLDPARGGRAGGTRVSFIGFGEGFAFAPGDTMFFGDEACTEWTVASPTRAECVAPASLTATTVDVRFVPADADAEETLLTGAFTYFDASDPIAGGLGGGPIQGSINITILDRLTRLPLPGAYVSLGNDYPAAVDGRTNTQGQVTLAADGLTGPVTLNAAAFCHEATTVVSMDASSVTLFLDPWFDLRCIEFNFGDQTGIPRAGVSRNGAIISGELRFPGPNENAPNPWTNVPVAREGEVRVAYVQTTTACATCGTTSPTSDEGTFSRITEDMVGSTGNPYRISSRPAALAVYAVAGIENLATGAFTPYLMGIHRGLLAGPEQELTGTNIEMRIALDRPLEVSLDDLPGPGPNGPDRFRLRATMDLGGEGFIRPIAGSNILDQVVRFNAEGTLSFLAQPALAGQLADGRYYVDAAWVTGESLTTPLTNVARAGVRPTSGPVALDGFIGIPVATAPGFGQLLPADRVLRWESTGDDPDIWMVFVTGSDGNPQWRHFVRGDVHEAPLPNFGAEDMIEDVASGEIEWEVRGVNVPDFDFDSFTYSSLSTRRWTAWTIDSFTAQR